MSRKFQVNYFHHDLDDLAEYVDQEHFFNTVSIQHSGVSTVLELYRASQVRICGEGILEKIHSWTSAFLRKQLLNHSIQSKRLREQVIIMKQFRLSL